MKMVLKQFLVVLIICVVAAVSTRDEQPKKIDCRKYVFARACRGVTAKRDTSRLNQILEDRRYLQEDPTSIEVESAKLLNDNVLSYSLLDTLLRKLNSKNVDYDTGTVNYLH